MSKFGVDSTSPASAFFSIWPAVLRSGAGRDVAPVMIVQCCWAIILGTKSERNGSSRWQRYAGPESLYSLVSPVLPATQPSQALPSEIGCPAPYEVLLYSVSPVNRTKLLSGRMRKPNTVTCLALNASRYLMTPQITDMEHSMLSCPSA
jgi:hypothetical protein